MRDERRIGFREGRAEGYAEVVNEAIAALKGILDPAIIAEKFKWYCQELCANFIVVW